MRIFLLCLLAVGGIAAEVANKTDTTKHDNRRLLSRSSTSVENNEKQLLVTNGNEHSQHQQSTYTGGSRSGIDLGSEYTSGLSYTSGALPIGYQFYSSDNYDNLGVQRTLQQLGQGSLVSGGIQQFGQSLYQPFEGSIGTSNQPIQSGVISRLVQVPVNLPHTVQVIRTAQQVPPQQHSLPVEVRRPVNIPVSFDVTKTYPINVDRPIPVPTTQPYEVPHPVPVPLSVLQPVPIPYQVPHHAVQINSEYETDYRPNVFVGEQGSGFNVHDVSHHHDTSAPLEHINLGSQQHNFDAGSQQHNFDVGSQQHNFDVGSQQHNFNVGSQQHNFDVGSQQHNFDLVPQQQHFDLGVQQFDFGYSGISEVGSNPSFVEHVQPSLLSAVTEEQHSGYVYDKPTKKFTF